MTNEKRTEAEIIQRLAEELLIDGLKIYTAAQLKDRFMSQESNFQHDLVIRHMGGIFENIAKKDPARTITSSEIGKMYNDMITLYPNSKFKEAFGDLLPEEIEQNTISDKEKASRIRHELETVGRNADQIQKENQERKEKAEAMGQAPDMLSELASCFDQNILGNGMYHSDEIKQLGSLLVKSELGTHFSGTIDVDLKVSTPDLLLYSATLETKEGKKYLNVPVEVKKGNLLIPTAMASNNSSVYDLSKEGLGRFFIEEKQAQADLHSQKVAQQHEKYIYDGVREDLADIEIVEKDAFAEEFEQKEIKLNIPEIEDMLESSVLRSDSKFNDETIEEGERLVRTELAGAGFKNSQVRFGGSKGSCMKYKAALNTRAGKVVIAIPVEVVNDMPIIPYTIETEKGEFELSNSGINQYIDGNKEVVKPYYTAAFISMSYKNLNGSLQKAALNREYEVASEIISFIGEKFGEEAKKSAVIDYQAWMENSAADYSGKDEAFKGLRLGTPVKIDDEE